MKRLRDSELLSELNVALLVPDVPFTCVRLDIATLGVLSFSQAYLAAE